MRRRLQNPLLAKKIIKIYDNKTKTSINSPEGERERDRETETERERERLLKDFVKKIFNLAFFEKVI